MSGARPTGVVARSTCSSARGRRASAPGVAAVRVGHWAPGFGGGLRWTPGERLFHEWGCGTHCMNGNLYDVRGTTLRSFVGSAAWTSDDGRYAAIANAAGDVEVVEFEHGRTHQGSSRHTPCFFPIDVVWRANEVRVRFASEATAPVDLHPRPPPVMRRVRSRFGSREGEQ